jgi:hypothetical protein
MNQRIASFIIAERSICSIRLRIENEYLVKTWIRDFDGACEPKFKGHVEAYRRTGAAEVMYGDSAGLHQLYDARESSIALLAHFKRIVAAVPKTQVFRLG